MTETGHHPLPCSFDSLFDAVLCRTRASVSFADLGGGRIVLGVAQA